MKFYRNISPSRKSTLIFSGASHFIYVLLLFVNTILSKNEDSYYTNILCPNDTDGDGIYDLVNDDIGEKKPSCFNKASNTFQFIKVWEPDPSPQGLLDLVIDNLYSDKLNDIVFPFYKPPATAIYIYENVSDNNFQKVWFKELTSGGAGIIITMTIDDIDNNGKKDIIAGWYSRNILIFEKVANDSFIQKPSVIVNNDLNFRSITTKDTDKNGKKEIIIVNSDGNYGYFGILEDTQVIYEEKNNDYLVEVNAGCLDPDTFPDIIVTHGGWVENPVYFNVYEYTGSKYEKKAITLNGYGGFLLRTAIADIDLDGKNELAVSGAFNGGVSQLMILKSNFNDKYQIIAGISFESKTSPMDISIKNILYDEYPEIAVCTHSSGDIPKVFLFIYNGDSLKQIYETGEELNGNGAFQSVDLCFADQDSLPDILIAASGGKALLLEYQPITSIENNAHLNQISPQLSIAQSLSNNNVKITYTTNKNSPVQLDVYTLQGKKLRTIVNGFKHTGSHEVIWDGRSDSGAKVGNGCYLIRLVCGSEEVTRRVAVAR